MGNESAAARRIEDLRKEIARHDRLYYIEGAPEISDAAYDRLFAELRALEDAHPDLVTPNSPTQRVGAPPVDTLGKVTHLAPMLSLEAVSDAGAVAGFLDRIRQHTGMDDPVLVAEPKYDGLSVEVVYARGRFLRASTRGDGMVGEDISHTLRTVRSLPLRLPGARALPDRLAVRGEAILPKASFRDLNKTRTERGEDTFANPRNAAAGILRRLDPAQAEGIRLDVTFYDATGLDRDTVRTQWDLLTWLDDHGLRVGADRARCRTRAEAEAFHRDLLSRRDDLAMEIDGTVLKLDDLAARDDLGTRARSPRWALAWKFPPRRKMTRIADIAVSVGRTGQLTPIALLDPVDIGGVTVARATLHTAEEVARKDLRVGDTVRVERAGDVIPEVAGRVATPGQKRGPAFAMPQTCPACGTPVERRGPMCYCPAGIACPAQLRGRLVHFASRGALDIAGLGDRTAQQLVDLGLVGDVADIFDLTPDDLMRLDGFAATSAEKLHRAIRQARDVPLDRFIAALGIRHVGSDAARRLARAFHSLDALRGADGDALRAVPGIGDETADSLRAFFDAPRNRVVLDRLIAAGVTPHPVRSEGGALDGKTFVLTGTLKAFTRDEATDEIERRGGRVTSAVSGRTDYVVAGADPGTKLDDARAEGTAILDEDAFRHLLQDEGPPDAGS